MTERKAKMERRSSETEIAAELNVDGKGQSKINTPIGLLNHMLDLFAFHGFFDLTIDVQKSDDKDIDIHHTNEDIGIVLGKLFHKALDEKEGIRRFGTGNSPMESTLGCTVIDISGRGYLQLDYTGKKPEPEGEEHYTLTHLEHFLESFAHKLGANVNVRITNPDDSAADIHTLVETVFKSLGLALDEATQIDPRREGRVPSTKGIID